MAHLRVIVGRDPELLLRTAAADFFIPRSATPEQPYPTVPYLLALRQGGLRDDVLAMAAYAGVKGWFDPPLCIYQELPEWLGAPSRETLGDYERIVVLARLVREHGQLVFAKLERYDDFIDHIDRLFGELIAEGVSEETFSAALDARDGRDDFESRRDRDLGGIYAAYLAELRRIDRADGRDAWIHCAHALRDGTARLDDRLNGRREIRIFGLQDLRRGWLHLIRALAASSAIDRVVLYTSVELPLGELTAQWEQLAERAESPASALFALERSERRVGTATLIIAPDVERELDQVASDIQRLVRAGTPPHRIAIVAREARPNVDRAITALARVGVPATARQRTMLTSIPVVRAIASLFAAAADGWTRAGLVEIAYQPYFAGGLDADVLNAVGYRQLVRGLTEWERALAGLETAARHGEAPDAPERRGRPLPKAEVVAAVREAYAHFAAEARTLDEQRTLVGWLEWLRHFLRDDPWKVLACVRGVPGDRFDVVRLDLAGWASVTAIVKEWHGAAVKYGVDDRVLSVTQFNAQLLDFLTGDVPQWTPVYRGVQVLEALAAAYRSFDYLFVTGMEAGVFPKAAPTSQVLEDADRDALAASGIPLERRSVWDERERELFRVLVAGAARGFTMSYSRLDSSGREVIASAFVDELLDVASVEIRALPAAEVVLPGLSLYRTLDGPARALHGATIESQRLNRTPSLYNGRIEAPELVMWLGKEFGDDRMWSPSQLEEFAKCPWSYFSKRLLRIEKLVEPGEDVEASTRGLVLHEALKLFYDRAMARIGGPVFLEDKDREWSAAIARECTSEIVDRYAARNLLGHRSLLEAKRLEFVRIICGYLSWEIDAHVEMITPSARKKAPLMIRTGVVRHELPFDDITYEREGVRIHYRGTIDRVEVSIDERAGEAEYVVAADYKTTKSSTPGGGRPAAWTEGIVLQVPLYAYALGKLRERSQLARVGYLPLIRPAPKKADMVQQLELVRINRATQEVETFEKDEERYQAAMGAVVRHVQQARRGEFPAGPPGKCTCPPWCHGRDICRIPGGPVSR